LSPLTSSSTAKGTSDVEYTFHLYVRPKDAHAELWDGARSGVQAAQDVFNADEAGDIDNISRILPDILSGAKEVYTDIGRSSGRKSGFDRFLRPSSNSPEIPTAFQKLSTKPLRPLVNALRLTKSAAELDCMRLAGSASGTVITTSINNTPHTESQLWAYLSYGFKSSGLLGEAYVPVVAGGKNALSIHYTRNDALLADGEVVLVDAGGEYGGYITDITRTWPINGKFTDAQRDMYSMILGVQKSCIELCRADADMSLDKIHSICEDGLRDGLKALGFDVRGDTLQKLFPHHVGHHIGLDVHDAPGYSRTEALRENMCITIEPGIYVNEDKRWPEHFRGLGIRIEDSVVVGGTEVEVLTKAAVKEVDEVERRG
jgi:intermediate cleaving peptidase 55